jgi:hypothetical protein
MADGKRLMVINELISTEKTYVNRLFTTITVFIEPMRSANVLTPAEINDQFGCWEIIASHHRDFLTQLTSTSPDSIGSLMNSFCRGLTMYQPYLLIFEGALRKRAKLLVSNRRFNELVESARVNPICEGLSLESFLVLPVQRIPRYKLLLDEVKKCTPSDHPDYADISAACETVCARSTKSNLCNFSVGDFGDF